MKKCACPTAPLKEIKEFRKDSFSLTKVAAYLGWRVVRDTDRGDGKKVISRIRYPRLELYTHGPELIAVVLESEKGRGSMAVLASPSRTEFITFIRGKVGGQVKCVIVYSSKVRLVLDGKQFAAFLCSAS